jgi:hypothetical protein
MTRQEKPAGHTIVLTRHVEERHSIIQVEPSRLGIVLDTHPQGALDPPHIETAS